jgi:hypothetical protein
MDGDNAWSNFPETLNPGMCGATQPIPTDPACADQNLLVVRQVRVTLSARSMAPNMVGAVQDGNQTAGTEALRGQLSAVITPRAAKVGLDVP